MKHTTKPAPQHKPVVITPPKEWITRIKALERKMEDYHP